MEDAITLFIQGHGKEDINEEFKNDETVELLSFVGKPGELGTMKLCKKYNNKPIDIVVINYLHHFYSKQENENLNNIEQIELFHQMGKELPTVYANCGIEYKDGFTFTWPRLEREFIFEPAPHENCRICNCTSGRCLPERNINKICCPEYGLIVVSSSFKNDIPYTLGGENNRKMSNINIYMPARDYWKSRASAEYKYLVDQIYNEKYIHLTDLYLLFKSMGFKHIYIYDPTCRDCEIDELKAQQYRNQELLKPITEQPLINNKINSNTNTNIYTNTNTDYFNECINGICNYIQKPKTKVNGGKKKKKNKTKKYKIKKNKTNKNKKRKYKIF
jgi:hypothetical protein